MNQVCKNLYYLRVLSNPRLHHRFKSQKELASILHINQTKISRIENGHVIPDAIDLVSYAVYFGVSIDDICFGIYESRDGILDFYESPSRK